MEIKDEGICRFCLKAFAGRSMVGIWPPARPGNRKTRKEAAQGKNLARFTTSRFRYKPYWLHIEMPARAKLADLDSFLRGIWLECCGHLSEFTVNGLKYSSPGGMEAWWGPKPKSMNAQLHKVLNVKDKFEYEWRLWLDHSPGATGNGCPPRRARRQGEYPGPQRRSHISLH
jgi:hypothetical protein